ncbi:DUF4833 domain-containing protein [Vitiosangium sp. GDMCC 1.1324]|uniref:DUF4833 domain-containing protein n=1 Tax=Vitiosangium sp. (strain GDMCC 1.1324) TaxID=2138576 RepID=UPI000D35D6EB|nr:DUF4833 domain-containing protein [Vitiosangium sp. GDMCC 1.1324]PTL84386.1 DUF4833 domain-containing protein [Vitiosangium sp. GDMCC 1.1324]
MLPKNRLVSGVALALMLPARGTDSIFFIAKSENRNQVHYAVRVDESCRPLGANPVHGYWRMFERGETVVEPLLGIEVPVYGLADTQLVESTPGGWRVQVRLQAFAQRPISIAISQENGRCVTRAWTKVGEETARLDHVFVRMAWPFGIKDVVLNGVGPDGQSVSEALRP